MNSFEGGTPRTPDRCGQNSRRGEATRDALHVPTEVPRVPGRRREIQGECLLINNFSLNIIFKNTLIYF